MITKTKSRKKSSRIASENVKEGLHIYVAYWRANIHRFAMDYLNVNLHVFQIILLYMMDRNTFFMFIASRGLGKSFLISIYCCCRAILYPESKIIVGAGSRGQAKLLISQKIEKELMSMSPALRKEIKEIRCGANEARVIFWNGSTIEAVVSGDGSRGYRANILICDEFRLIDKDVLDKVMRPMLAATRTPKFMFKDKYKDYPKEQNKEIYLTSAWFKSHYAYEKFKSFTKNMCLGKDTFVCDLPYTVAVENGLLTKERVEAIKSEDDMNEVSFAMEMCGIWYGESDTAFYKSNDINPCRTLRKPFYPPTDIEYVANKDKRKKSSLPKQEGEIRIMGVDIAVASGKANDNSVFALLRVLPNGGEYQRQLVHMETYNGMKPEDQAIRIKQLFEDFEGDFIALDRSGVGASVWNELQKANYDVVRDKEYPPYTAINDDNTVDKISSRGALPVVYTIANPSAAFNSNVATELLGAFLSKKLRLLISDIEAKNELVGTNDFAKKSPTEQAYILRPYVQTTALVNELINLEYQIVSSNVKISEKGSARKDRYSAASYANYYAHLIEQEENKKRKLGNDEVFALW